jgi:hypothetical protein
MKKIYDLGNTLVILITFILFAIALFTTGFTKDLLLEAAVLLVSIKIITMSRVNTNSTKEILKKLDELNDKLNCYNSKSIEK